MVQCDLSPTELWTFTTNPDERNAGALVKSLRPAWSLAQVIAWLAENFRKGCPAPVWSALTNHDSIEKDGKMYRKPILIGLLIAALLMPV